MFVCFFFFNDTATTEIYTLSLHDALPISTSTRSGSGACRSRTCSRDGSSGPGTRSEEHTSELQSQSNLVCRLLLEKKKNNLLERAPSTPSARTSLARVNQQP